MEKIHGSLGKHNETPQPQPGQVCTGLVQPRVITSAPMLKDSAFKEIPFCFSMLLKNPNYFLFTGFLAAAKRVGRGFPVSAHRTKT